MAKQARNYSIKRDSMSYFPLEYINSPPTDSSGIYVGWNWAFPSNLLQCQCRKRGLEEENQNQGGAGTAVRRNIDYTPNQCEMLTGLLSRKSWQPNCVSWALPVSRCYYSYMQINNLWAEIKRGGGKAEDGKEKKTSTQALDQSSKYYHKHKNSEIPLPFRYTQVLCFFKKKK